MDQCVILIIVLSGVYCHNSIEKCPHSSHMKYRQEDKCGKYKPAYMCLEDLNKGGYVEVCESHPELQRLGYRVSWRYNLDGAVCDTKRFQPKIFSTADGSDCIYKKSICEEEGQIVAQNGSALTDTKCRCDHTKGYAFMTMPSATCYCIPSIEDCTCFKKSCSESMELSVDYTCKETIGANPYSKCLQYDNRNRNTVEGDLTPHRNNSKNEKGMCTCSGEQFQIFENRSATYIASVLFICIFVILVFVCLVFYRNRTVEKCSTYRRVLKIKVTKPGGKDPKEDKQKAIFSNAAKHPVDKAKMEIEQEKTDEAKMEFKQEKTDEAKIEFKQEKNDEAKMEIEQGKTDEKVSKKIIDSFTMTSEEKANQQTDKKISTEDIGFHDAHLKLVPWTKYIDVEEDETGKREVHSIEQAKLKADDIKIRQKTRRYLDEKTRIVVVQANETQPQSCISTALKSLNGNENNKDTTNVQKQIEIIDAHDVFPIQDTKTSEEEFKCSVKHNPHVVLLVIDLVRMSSREIKYIEQFLSLFDNKMKQFTVIIFKKAQQIGKVKFLKKIIGKMPDLQAIIDECEGRFCFLNTNKKQGYDNLEIEYLLSLIECLKLKNGFLHYTDSAVIRSWRKVQQKLQQMDESFREELHLLTARTRKKYLTHAISRVEHNNFAGHEKVLTDLISYIENGVADIHKGHAKMFLTY